MTFKSYQQDLTTSSDDPTLSFADTCPKMKSQIDTSTLQEQSALWDDLNLPSIVESLSEELNWTLTSEDLQLLYSVCQAEYAILNITEGVCTLLTDFDFQYFEFAYDLTNYCIHLTKWAYINIHNWTWKSDVQSFLCSTARVCEYNAFHHDW